MSELKPKKSFCKNSKKIFKQFVYILLAITFISNLRYLFVDETTYLSHLFGDLAYSLYALIFFIVESFFETDCIHYDDEKFLVDRGGLRAFKETFKYADIEKINYMPYLRLLTIKVKNDERGDNHNQCACRYPFLPLQLRLYNA